MKWTEILEQEPPFVPAPDSDTDTTYFNAKNIVQKVQVSSVDISNNTDKIVMSQPKFMTKMQKVVSNKPSPEPTPSGSQN